MSNPEPTSSRRDFFRCIGRGGLGAAVTALGALLAVDNAYGRNDETCIALGLCQRCRALDRCRLPRAQVVRRTAAEKS